MMNKGIRGLFVIASASLLAACASQPSPTSAAKAPATKGDAAIAAGKAVPTSGYRKVVRNGVNYYCSRDGYTGSRLDNKVQCLTEEQLAAIRNGAQDMLRRQQNHGTDPAMPNGPMGGTAYSAANPAP